MSKLLYVGNLPLSTSEEDLTRLVSQYGTVLYADILVDHETNRPRGVGGVRVQDEEVARVIEHLNGASYQGRVLDVSEIRCRVYA